MMCDESLWNFKCVFIKVICLSVRRGASGRLKSLKFNGMSKIIWEISLELLSRFKTILSSLKFTN